MVIYLCLGKNVKFITFMIFTKNLKPMCTKVFCNYAMETLNAKQKNVGWLYGPKTG